MGRRLTTEVLTIGFCVGPSCCPFCGLPDSGLMKTGSKKCAQATCTFAYSCLLKREAHLVFPAGSTYVVFSSINHFPAAMTCKTES